MPENDAVAAFGIAPRDGTFVVAHHVTSAALEALLVIEQDAPVVGGHEQLRRARPHTRLGGAAFTNLCVDDDVGLMRHTKIHCVHTIIETQRCLRSRQVEKRGNRHTPNLEPSYEYVEPAPYAGRLH